MKISEYISRLYGSWEYVAHPAGTSCDGLKAGDPERPLTKAAVSMFATPGVIREAAEWGAELLIVHEPVFYLHTDDPAVLDQKTGFPREILEAKRRLIRESGITIWRYHDRPHLRKEDLICQGELLYSGLKEMGDLQPGPYFGIRFLQFRTPLPLRELAELLKKRLHLGHLRLCGAPDLLCSRLGLGFGTPGHIEEILGSCDAVLTGEICEWAMGEFVRDCCALGHPKAILVMGHTGSERDGMRLLAEELHTLCPEIEARYWECGEVYQTL